MGVESWWSERSQGEKVAVALGGGCCLVPVLIALLVVVAAVLGTFVLGLGEPVESSSPQVQFDFERTDDGVAVTHVGGDTVRASTLRIVVDGTAQAWPGSGEVTAGDRATVAAASGSTVRIVWTGEGERATLGVFPETTQSEPTTRYSDAAGGRTGAVTSKRAPPSTESSTPTVQPWASATERTMSRPRPVPSAAVV